MFVNPDSWRTASAQIGESALKLQDGRLSLAVGRNDVIRILEELAAHTPDDTGNLRSLIQVVQDSTEEKLAVKVGMIATELARQADVAVGLDEGFIGPMGSD